MSYHLLRARATETEIITHFQWYYYAKKGVIGTYSIIGIVNVHKGYNYAHIVLGDNKIHFEMLSSFVVVANETSRPRSD